MAAATRPTATHRRPDPAPGESLRPGEPGAIVCGAPEGATYSPSGGRLRLFYFYDLPLPCEKAAPIQILRTAHALAEHGARVTVCVGEIEGGDSERALGHYGLSPHPGLDLVQFFPSGRRRLMTTLDRGTRLERVLPRADGRLVVMSRGETGLALYPTIRRLRRRGFSFVYEVHRLGFERHRETTRAGGSLRASLRGLRVARIRRRERRTVEGADGLVCLTRGVRDVLAEHFDLRDVPIQILPSGTQCRPSDARAPNGDDERDIDILYVGKLVARKGVDLLVRSAALLPEATVCVVGGSAPQVRRLREAARRRGIPDARFLLPGYVRPADVTSWYDRAKVGVCPLPVGRSATAERYTSPMKVLEMMAAGIPVVATDVPAIRELLRHGETALLVPPERPAPLAEAVRRLLWDTALADRLRRGGLETVQRYCWPVRARKLLGFLASLS